MRYLLFATVLMTTGFVFSMQIGGNNSAFKLGSIEHKLAGVVIPSGMIQIGHAGLSKLCKTPLDRNSSGDVLASFGVAALGTAALYNGLAGNRKIAEIETASAAVILVGNIARKLYQKRHHPATSASTLAELGGRSTAGFGAPSA